MKVHVIYDRDGNIVGLGTLNGGVEGPIRVTSEDPEHTTAEVEVEGDFGNLGEDELGARLAEIAQEFRVDVPPRREVKVKLKRRA